MNKLDRVLEDLSKRQEWSKARKPVYFDELIKFQDFPSLFGANSWGTTAGEYYIINTIKNPENEQT